jgi:hypothetical protein
MLESQSGVCVRLFIWNNNWWNSDKVKKKISKYNGIEVDVLNSIFNVGGFGRFYLAKKISNKFPLVIFIDDDQNLGNRAIHQLWSEGATDRISAWWAFNFQSADDYLDRKEVSPGEEATYCGTGGMVCPTWVFEHDALFNKCPKKFWFIEDLWLSYFADHVLGMDLKKSSAEISIEKDDKNQAGELLRKKSKFLFRLVDKGWSI